MLYFTFIIFAHLSICLSKLSSTSLLSSIITTTDNCGSVLTHNNGSLIETNERDKIISSISIHAEVETYAELQRKMPMNSSANVYFSKYMGVTFINGILHTPQDLKRLADLITNIFSIECRPFYNPSSGSFVRDISKAGYDIFQDKMNFRDMEIAKQLAEHLRINLANIHPKGRILHIAHSGGAILTYLAAKHFLLPFEKERIDIITFGGGRSITRKYFRHSRVINYYSNNDPLTMVDKRAGVMLQKSGCKSKPVFKNEVVVYEICDPKHNTPFIFLHGMTNNPVRDHSLEEPTYLWCLEREATDMWIRMIEIAQRDLADTDRVRQFRKRFANYTGLHNFFSRTNKYNPFHQLRKLTFENADGPDTLINKVIPTIERLTATWTNVYNDAVTSSFNGVRSARKIVANITGARGFFSKKYMGNSTTEVT